MARICTITPRPEALAHRVDASRALVVAVTLGLVLVTSVSLVVSGAVRAGIAPSFDQQIVLDDQHRLVIHNGPSPICVSIPNPPQHDCFWPGRDSREFSLDYFTPNGARSLVWFQLPPR